MLLYQKEIDDGVLIQFIILYTLSKVDSAVPYNELINLVLNNCNINYGDFQVALDNLVKTNHARAFIPEGHNQKYEITSKGANVVGFFTPNIPIYIREPIDESIKELFLEERRRNAVSGNITPVRGNEYNVDCALKDDDKTELLNLSIYAGSRAEAEKMAVFFRKHYDFVYEKIIEAFSTRLDEEDE